MSESVTNGMTPLCRINFPAIFEPKLNELSGATEYSCQLLISKDEDISAMQEHIENALEKQFGNKRPAKLNMGIRDGDEEFPDREDFVNCWFINLKSKDKPGVVDHDVDPITDPSKLQSGDFVKVTYNCYGYDKKGNKGAAFGLRNIQKIRNGDPISGSRPRAQDEFESEDPTAGGVDDL